MNKLVQFFGLPLSILFGSTFLLLLVSLFILFLMSGLGYQQIVNLHLFSAGPVIGAIVSIVLLLSLGVSLLYIFTSGFSLFTNSIHKKKSLKKELKGERILLRGIVGIILTLLLFFVFAGYIIFVSRPFCPSGVDLYGDCLISKTPLK
jgi:hypothetical protein